MSEDPNQLPGEPEAPEPQPGRPEEIAPANGPQYPPTPEVYIQPAEAAPAPQLQYPPLPESYMQPASQDPYGNPATGYGVPPVDYGVPSSGYGAPPAALGGSPAGYGAPAFSTPQATYGYGYEQPPQAQPLPLGQAIRELPGQYKKVLLKPGPRAFATEQSKAEWGIIWLQVLFITLLEILVALPLFAFNNVPGTVSSTPGVPLAFYSTFYEFEAIALVVLAPLSFFAVVGIQYLIARAFKGNGSFKQQAYNQLLFQVPISVVTAALSLIVSPLSRQMSFSFLAVPASSTQVQVPLLNPSVLLVLLFLDLISFAISIYGIVLNVFSIMATHGIPGGKATSVVLIPYGVLVGLFVLAFCGLFLIGILAAASTAH